MRRVFSLPLAVVAVLTIFFYRMPARSASGVTDVDYWWHLAYGDWILEHGKLPVADLWSWSLPGKPYQLTQWLGEVVMALANRMGGETGTQMLAALLVALTIGFSYRAARHNLSPILALLVAIGCNTILLSLACRPHQFTHLGLAIVSALVTEYLATGKRTALCWLPLLFVAWVNLHGGYALGLVYLGLCAGLAFLGSVLRHKPLKSSPGAALALAMIVSLLATLLNPAGIGAWQYVFEVSGMQASSAGIVDEWAAVSVKNEAGLHYFMVVSAIGAAMAAASRRPTVETILGFFVLVGMGWASTRVAVMVLILMVPLLAEALETTRLADLINADRRMSSVDRVRWPVALLVLILAGGLSWAMNRADQRVERKITADYPVDAMRFITERRIEGRIMNSLESGGYLIRVWKRPVFIDTRLDLYGDRFLFEYLLARRGEAGWEEWMDRHGPEIVLIENAIALRQLLIASRRYRLVFEGVKYSVLLRPDVNPDLPAVVPAERVVSLTNQLLQ